MPTTRSLMDLPTRFLFSLLLVLILCLSVRALAQEKSGFRLPDSARVYREPITLPSFSMTPVIPPSPFYSNQFSRWDQVSTNDPDMVSTHNDTWKRSFLLGASTYHGSILQMSQLGPGKETFFQKMTQAISIGGLAGAAFLGYKAIKGERITKEKKKK
jgi:hypothetical protein